MLPVQALKSIRKWRDRLYMLGERALDRAAFPQGRRIRFWPWPELEEPVRRGFWGTRHEVSFGPIPPGGEGFDVVVPLSVEALKAAAADAVLCRRNPLPIPDAAVVDLCDDKAALNARLVALGFGRHVPAAARPGRYPYMLKLRRDACARNAHRISGPADEATHRERIGSPDYLRQEWIEGPVEYTAHLLVIGGRVRRALSMSYRMQEPRGIRGRDPIQLGRRCHSQHLGLFESMLQRIGFEGLCCVNYKLRDGVPVILEINPRFGFSLGPFFAAFIRSLEWERAPRVPARAAVIAGR